MVFPDTTDFLWDVQRIAARGGEVLMEYWQQLRPEQVSFKAVNDLVSVADRRAEEAILEEIRTSFPDHRVLSEESGWRNRDRHAPAWIVDPLDGTTNFVQTFPHFCVSIGVMIENRVDYAVILDPLKNDVFSAARGHGSFRNSTPITVSQRTQLEGSVLTTGFPFKAHDLLDDYLAVFREVFLGCKAIRRTGSAALDLAYTACGIFDGFFEFALSPWDIAAGSLLIEEAGGAVSDPDGGSDFLDSGNVVCGPPGVHRELIAIIENSPYNRSHGN